MADPDVTLVVVARERFSCARRSLESICAHTTIPFRLVYVDGGSPTPIKRYLEAKALEEGFLLLREDQYLSPNRARNLGLREVRSRYVVFIDNDVLVGPSWLEALVRCAEETGAWVVGPLYLMGEPERQIIHMAGGISHIRGEEGKRILWEKDHFSGMRLADVPISLQRGPCELVEFHCMLARTDVFDRLGPLDEELLSVREHDDLCLAVREAGGSIYVEPTAIVTYLPPPPLAWSDLSYYTLRWSEIWIEASLKHFHDKWNLDMDMDDPHYAWLRDRRYLFLGGLSESFRSLRGFIRTVLGERRMAWMRQASLSLVESALNQFFTRNPRG